MFLKISAFYRVLIVSSVVWIIENKEPIPVGPRTLKNILQDVKSTLPKLDERGSFSFEDLKPEKIEAFRRLFEDIRRSGRSLEDYIKEKDLTEDVVQSLKNIHAGLNKREMLVKPSTGTEDFQTGISENIGENMLSKLSGWYRVLVVSSIIWIVAALIGTDPWTHQWGGGTSNNWNEFLLSVLPVVVLWGIIWIVKGFKKNKN